jgi:hypothetical protein
MMILDNLALFLRIVEKGGLAAAGRELGLSAASVWPRWKSTMEQRCCIARREPSA